MSRPSCDVAARCSRPTAVINVQTPSESAAVLRSRQGAADAAELTAGEMQPLTARILPDAPRLTGCLQWR